MVWIEPGTFTMGSPGNEAKRDDDEGPQTQVELTKGYWLGKYEVTQGEYAKIMGNNPSEFKKAGERVPVENVSWNEAMEFSKKLTQRERRAGRLPEGYAYTLPTEAQWEYSCRAGTTTRYNTGNAASDLKQAGWYSGNSTTHPVGEKQANRWGLYDMHGNVWEWCADWYEDSLPGGRVSDPVGASSGSFRVSRGGGWFYYALRCRSAARHRWGPDSRRNNLGFRLALRFVR